MRQSRALSLTLGFLFFPLACVFAQEAQNAFPKMGDRRAGSERGSTPSLTIRKIYLVPGSDDVGQALANDLDGAVFEVLQSNSRFQVMTNPKVGEAIRASDKGYERVIVSPEVHMRAARLTGADTTIVNEIKHSGAKLILRQDWRRSDGTLLFSEADTMQAATSTEDQKQVAKKLTNSIIGRIPYKGSITGKTGDTVTLDLNEEQINLGDRVQLARIVSTKEHPLLKTLVNVDYVATGYAEVISADNVLSFARVISQEPGEEVGVDNKVMRVDRGSGEAKLNPRAKQSQLGPDRWQKIEHIEKKTKDPLSEEAQEEQLTGDFERKKARYGAVSARLLYGSIGHSESRSGSTTDLSGSGFGGGFQGELWITKVWTFNVAYDFLSADLSGKTPASTSARAPGTAWNKFDIFAAYRYIPDGDLDNTFVVFGLGYQAVNVNLPYDQTNQIGKKQFSGLLLHALGDIVFDHRNRIEVGLGLQPFSSAGELNYVSGQAEGASVVNVGVRWKWRWLDTLWAFGSIDYTVASGSFTGGRTISDKRFSISPGLTYTF